MQRTQQQEEESGSHEVNKGNVKEGVVNEIKKGQVRE